MRKNQIPRENRDLRRYAVWKNLKYLLGYLAYIASLAFGFAFYLNGRHENAEPLAWWVYYLYPAAVLVSGWFIFCMNRFVSDVSFTGKIVSMDFKRDFDRGIDRRAGFSLDDHTYVRIAAIDEKGKKRKTRVTLFDDGFDCYYREGATLIKTRGLNYPIVPESENEGNHICAVCGVRTYYKEGKMIHGEAEPRRIGDIIICRSCGHTLIGK